jgi:hypothetical protein
MCTTHVVDTGPSSINEGSSIIRNRCNSSESGSKFIGPGHNQSSRLLVASNLHGDSVAGSKNMDMVLGSGCCCSKWQLKLIELPLKAPQVATYKAVESAGF